jgi:hypothetical protein
MVSRTLAILALTSSTALAQSPCNYDQIVETNWSHTIEKTSNIDKKVFPYVDDTRKCVMKFDVTINGTVYSTSGSYVFGPDATENYACEQATIKGKKSIIGEVSPEMLTAKTEMNCGFHDEKNKPQEVASVQISNQLPTHEPAPRVTSEVVRREVRVVNQPQVTERRIVVRNLPVYPVYSSADMRKQNYISRNPVDNAISGVVDLILGTNRY